jgi:Icc-related predicted phosphoesterase
MVKIVAVTDVHGSYQQVEKILHKVGTFDAVIIGGDLTTYGTRREADSAIRRFADFLKPLLIVAGNMDPPELDDLFVERGLSINGRGIVIGDVGFFGVSAAPYSPLHTPNEVSEEEILRRAQMGWKDIEGAPWKVFVPHAPPHGTKLDVAYSGHHVGSTAVREFIEKNQPDLTICGHIHEARGEDTIGRTKVVNCGPAGHGHYALIESGQTLSVSAQVEESTPADGRAAGPIQGRGPGDISSSLRTP